MEPITELEIRNRIIAYSDSRGVKKKEFDVLVNMHAGLSQQFWGFSLVERCVDQVLTLLKAQSWSFLESRTSAISAGRYFITR